MRNEENDGPMIFLGFVVIVIFSTIAAAISNNMTDFYWQREAIENGKAMWVQSWDEKNDPNHVNKPDLKFKWKPNPVEKQ